MSNLKENISESFTQYAGAVLQSRALVDVRDGLKPSARQIFYSMLIHKLVHKNPYKKTANAVGMAMADFYIHGDSSCEGVIMRAGQDFAMRYPLVEVSGNAGTLIESGNWAAPRYTESRLSSFSDLLFKDIDKDTIKEWRDNYDNTKQYPSVLPTKGFYNIVNGTQGIGIGMACSVPQYNLKEVNSALIYLIDHPDCEFDDVYCAPDFATGGILYNEAQVKESMRKGTGFACKLRSVVEFDEKERCFVVTEIPYSVYTNTICAELEGIINSEENPGIERFNDLTGRTPLIKIYLAKRAIPEKVLKYLYKNTSLQSHFGINFTMLDDGRFPRVFGWKEMLQAHIAHEVEVYRRGFEYDLKKIEDRIHIINGLLICLASIDEVVKTIKNSASSAIALTSLQKVFLLTEVQAKAVLDMKLSRLAHLEVEKLKEELKDLQSQADKINSILNSEVLFNNELKKGWKDIATKYGDDRRTKVINLCSSDSEEPIEQKQVVINLTNFGNLYSYETSTLVTQRRNGAGTKQKLVKGEHITVAAEGSSVDILTLFSNKGKFYNIPVGEVISNESINISELISLEESEYITNIIIYNKNCNKKFIAFITKNGMIKKSLISEYHTTRKNGAQAIKLKEGDSISEIIFINEEPLGICTSAAQFVIIETKDISAIGKIAMGVKAIGLYSGDTVVGVKPITKEVKEIISITEKGMASRTKISDFSIVGRGAKGVKLQRLNEDDKMINFLPIKDEDEITITTKSSVLKTQINAIPVSGRGALGVHSIKLKEKDKIIEIF